MLLRIFRSEKSVKRKIGTRSIVSNSNSISLFLILYSIIFRMVFVYFHSTTSEDTQATEETLEDIYKDICRDENNVKIEAKDSSFFGDEEQILREANNDPLSGNDRSKVICKVCLGDQNHNKLGLPEVLISCSQCASTSKFLSVRMSK